MKIGFLCVLDPEDRRNFSGTLFYMLMSLREIEGTEVDIVGKQFFDKQKQPNSFLARFYAGLSRRIKLVKKLDSSLQTKSLVNICNSNISENNYDILVAPVASRLIARVDTYGTPVIFITDATPKFVEDFYGWPVSKNEFANEILTLKKSSLVIYSSDFMKELAAKDYKNSVDSEKLISIPFGLNLDNAPAQPTKKNLSDGIKLLFVARFWERKGGDIAIETLSHLLKDGHNAHLTIIGCSPNLNEEISKHTTIIPFLNKNDPQQQAEYFDILSKSSFFVLPTRADCTPMVIAEANAFSTPVLVTDVGGIGSLVTHGENGYLTKLDDRGDVYAKHISSILANSNDYTQLSEASFKRYKEELNWQSWAHVVLNRADELASK